MRPLGPPPTRALRPQCTVASRAIGEQIARADVAAASRDTARNRKRRANLCGSSKPSVCHAPFPPNSIAPSSEGCISRVEDPTTQSNLEIELAAKQENLQGCVATPMTVSSARDLRDVAMF